MKDKVIKDEIINDKERKTIETKSNHMKRITEHLQSNHSTIWRKKKIYNHKYQYLEECDKKTHVQSVHN